MAEIPFLTTTVPVIRTVHEISRMLGETGFDQIATIQDSSGGKYRVIAVYRGAQFEFSVQSQGVADKIRQDAPIRYFNKTDTLAPMIAWRCLYHAVKSACDSIKLGVVSPAQAFSGMLVIARNRDGSTVLLADRLTENIERGQFDGQNLLPEFTSDGRKQ
ncbi:MAG: hypothetical protein AB1664_15660 [Thermodesulfobacteriota bacterium]